MYEPRRNSELLSVITAPKPPVSLNPSFFLVPLMEGLLCCLQGSGETEGGFCFRNCPQEARGWSRCKSNESIDSNVSVLPAQTHVCYDRDAIFQNRCVCIFRFCWCKSQWRESLTQRNLKWVNKMHNLPFDLIIFCFFYLQEMSPLLRLKTTWTTPGLWFLLRHMVLLLSRRPEFESRLVVLSRSHPLSHPLYFLSYYCTVNKGKKKMPFATGDY